MSLAASIVSIIAVLGAMVLAWSGLRSHNLPDRQLLKLAGIWIAIIIGLVLFLRLLGA